MPAADRLVLKPGDEITVSGFWLPYGEVNGAKTPAREIIAFGKDQPRVVDVQKGFVLNNLPTTIQVENDEAQFTIRGGLNVLPIIATGLNSYQYPALYEKIGDSWEFVHMEHTSPFDGMQLFCDKDGKFGAVFLIRTNGEAREFRIKSAEPYPNFKRIEIQPEQSSKAEVSINNPFEKLRVKLIIDNQIYTNPIHWNESSGKSFWYGNSLKDTLSGARVTGFEDHVEVQYWWQNSTTDNMIRSPKFELEIDANLFAGKFKAFVYKNGQLSECQNINKTIFFETGELSYGVQPGIIVLYNSDKDYCLALSFKNASTVFLKNNSVGVILSKQNCPMDRRKVMEGNVYLVKGSPARLQGIIEQELPVWKSGQTAGQMPVSDHDPVHSLGNGKMCIYEKGPNIITAYSGPYSSPSFLKLDWIKDDQAESQAKRKPGTAIWTHNILSGANETGILLDFVDAEIPCFVRRIQSKSKINFRVKLEKYVQVIDNTGRL
ncbi:MAG: hypothetical protein NTV01_04230, partial [Bacteroidia bacterium]|nr:hypothetical protein [Bacteroidia bacterium]